MEIEAFKPKRDPSHYSHPRPQNVLFVQSLQQLNQKITPESLIEFRTKYNLSQAEFGKLMGVSERTIWSFENKRIGFDKTKHIAATKAMETVQRLEERHILNNSPRVATDINLGYVSTSQVNIAQVEPWASEKDLTTSLGSVGEAHWDMHDDPLGMTGMTCVSSLPSGYHPGFFFLLEFGLFIKCDKYTTLVFSGLHRHGGTPPRAPPNVIPA